MNYYFAYGSNLSEEQMKKRCPNSKLIGKAVLKGYKLDFTLYSSKWEGGCADIVGEENSEVWGLIYELSDNDIKKLDQYECPAYRRVKLKVINTSDEEKEVYVYEVVNKKVFIAPSENYLDIIKKAAKKFNFLKEYSASLDLVKMNSKNKKE